MGRFDRKVTLTDESGDPINVGNPLATTGSGGGGGGGTSQADKSAFGEGTGMGTPIMGVVNDTPLGAVAEDKVGAVRITPFRGLHISVRDENGDELGTALAPFRIDPTGATVQPVSGTVTITDGGGSITVDGTLAVTQSGSWTVAATQSGSWSVSISGSVTVANLATADYDTGAGTVTQAMIGIALPASGGPVAGGTATNPVRTDPTGNTAQPVTDGGGSLTVDGSVSVSGSVTVTGTVAATQSGTWAVQLTDGSLTASIRNTGSNDSLNVAIVDASGNQISSFGGGTQYIEADTDATPMGTVSMWWNNGDNSIHAASPTNPFPVTVVSGGGGGMVDDSPFTPGSDTVVPMGALFDDVSTDTVDEGDIGAPRMSGSRILYVSTFAGSPVAVSDDGGSITVDGIIAVSATVPTVDKTASDSIVGNTQTVEITGLDGYATVVAQISGTFSGNLNFEGTANGTDWRPIKAYSHAYESINNSFIDTEDLCVINCSGLEGVRVVGASWSSGTADVFLRACVGSNPALFLNQDGYIGAITTVNTLGNYTNRNTAGTLTVVNADVEQLVIGFSTTSLEIAGVWVGEIEFEALTKASGTWKPIPVQNVVTREFVTSTTANGSFLFNSAGYLYFRVKAISLSSGSATIDITSTIGVPSVSIIDPVAVTDNGGSLTVDGTVSISGSVTVTGTVAATQSGSWTVTANDGGGSLTVDGTVAVSSVAGTVTVVQSTATNLKVDASGVAVPVTDNGGSLTVDGTVAISGSVTVTGTVAATQSGSWTVTANAGSGTFAVDQVDTASLDYDSGAGTVNQTVLGIALPGAGGPVAGGTATNPVRTDPTGTTAQPITDNGGSLTVDGTVAVSSVAGNVTVVQGTATNLKVDASGVAVPVTDNGGSLTVDGTVAISGSVTVTGTVAATQSGAWNIGLNAGTNNIGDVDVLTLPAVTQGTSPWAVGDGGGSLTVDGTVAVAGTTASGTSLVGVNPVFVGMNSGSGLGRFLTAIISNRDTDGTTILGVAPTAYNSTTGLYPDLEAEVSAVGSVSLKVAQADVTQSASISTAFDTVSVFLSGHSTMTIDITGGVWNGTFRVLGYTANNFFVIPVTNVETGVTSLTITGSGMYRCQVAGCRAAGLQSTIWSAGTALCALRATIADNLEDLKSQIALAASANNIGDVDVVSIIPGTAATNLGKEEDAAHASGDTGVMALAVRSDTMGAATGADGDYVAFQLDQFSRLPVFDRRVRSELKNITELLFDIRDLLREERG